MISIVAGGAITGNTRVAELRRSKHRGVVAHEAILFGWHVIGYGILTHGKTPVVTTFTATINARMIETRRGKSIGIGVTYGAILYSGNMIHMFTHRGPGTMTLRAVIHYTRMAELGGGK